MNKILILCFLFLFACGKNPKDVLIPSTVEGRLSNKVYQQAVYKLDYHDKMLYNQFISMWESSGQKRFPNNLTIGRAIDAHIKFMAKASSRLGAISRGTNK